MTTYNIIFAGVGGQGVITASGLLARAAVASGLDVRMYGSYGMAQRGGSVSAHLRIGEKVLNARVEKGESDLVMSMELVEAVRWAPFLAANGRLVSSITLVPPAGKLIKDGGAKQIDFLKGIEGAILLDTDELAGPAGFRGIGAVLLGAASTFGGFPVVAGAIEERLRAEFEKNAGPVVEAFRRGREAVK